MKRLLFIFMLPGLSGLILLAMHSCNNKESGKNKATKESTVTGDAPCLTLNKDQIQRNWVDEGSTDPREPASVRIQYLTFIPSPDPAGGINVSVQAYNSTDEKISEPIELGTGNACIVPLPPLLFGTNSIDLNDLGIINPGTGDLVEFFEKIILRPAVYKFQGLDLLQFYVTIEIGDNPTSLERGILPCPPCYYCKPIEPGCIIPTKDTIINGDTLIVRDSVKAK